MNNNGSPKMVLNYRPNGRRRLGRPLQGLLDVPETGLSRPNSLLMNMMMVMMMMMTMVLIMIVGRVGRGHETCIVVSHSERVVRY